jgi:hypothetical protein
MRCPFCHCSYLAEVVKVGIGSGCNTGSSGPSKGPELVFWKLPAKRNGRRSKVIPDLAAGVQRRDPFALAELSHFWPIAVENAERIVLSEVCSSRAARAV